MQQNADHELSQVIGRYRFAYLLTVGASGQAHAVAVQPTLTDGVLRLPPVGSHSSRNIGDECAVSLVWPPDSFDGYSLIVDGSARPVGDDVVVTPTRAVLHRPHEHDHQAAATGTGCVSDCVPLDLPGTVHEVPAAAH